MFYALRAFISLAVPVQSLQRQHQGLALVHQLYLAVAANGGAQAGTQALMLALERLNGDPANEIKAQRA